MEPDPRRIPPIFSLDRLPKGSPASPSIYSPTGPHATGADDPEPPQGGHTRRAYSARSFLKTSLIVSSSRSFSAIIRQASIRSRCSPSALTFSKLTSSADGPQALSSRPLPFQPFVLCHQPVVLVRQAGEPDFRQHRPHFLPQFQGSPVGVLPEPLGVAGVPFDHFLDGQSLVLPGRDVHESPPLKSRSQTPSTVCGLNLPFRHSRFRCRER